MFVNSINTVIISNRISLMLYRVLLLRLAASVQGGR